MLSSCQKYFLGIAGMIVGVMIVGVVVYFLTKKKEPYGGAVYTMKTCACPTRWTICKSPP